jgi:large subunit ribosomal protein L22
LAADLIRGLSVKEAEKQLVFLNKKAAQPILKLLKSAAANAKSNLNVEKDDLYVAGILVDSGPALKRYQPRAMGRAGLIMKRTSHITLDLGVREQAAAKAKPKKAATETAETKEKSFGLVPEEKAPEKLAETGRVEKEREKIVERPKPDFRKPYKTTPQSKKRFFSRQTFGNAKKLFRRKSI